MVKISGFQREISHALKQYSDEVEDELEKAQKKTAGAAAKELRETSPVQKGSETNPRNYAKGWTSKKVKKGYVVHNKHKPSLTHLLEKGHAKPNGGRTRTIRHIAPVAEQASNKFAMALMGALRR